MNDENSNVIDNLLTLDPFGIDPREKSSLLLEALTQSYAFHFNHCPAYRRFCIRRGFGNESRFASIEEIPYLPVQAFKEFPELLISVPRSQISGSIQSSATSGVPSTILIDKITAKRQRKALAAVMSKVLGPRRRPFLVLDIDPRKTGLGALGARSAAVQGFLNLASRADYFMESDQKGNLILNTDSLLSRLDNLDKEQEPVVVFGFTYVLYAHTVVPLLSAGQAFKLPPGSKVVHIGGWKKLEGQKVAKEDFNNHVARLFGIEKTSVVDFYGFTEQMGITYPDAPNGYKYAPVFAEVLVRDPQNHSVLGPGQEGLLEFVTPLPHSYAGIAVLTDDIGMTVAPDTLDGEWKGTPFLVLGRAKKAEIRGCGDIMATKVIRPVKHIEMGTPTGQLGVRVLLDPDGLYVPDRTLSDVDVSRLPQLVDLRGLIERLRAGRSKLDLYSVDEIIVLIGAAAERWLDGGSPLAPLKHQGLFFLKNWCSPDSLTRVADASLQGARGYLDGFRGIDGTNRKMMRARERGLAVHWLSGNVPVLGMLTVAQSMLARNANLIKASRGFSTVVPLLLESFRGLEVKTWSGKMLRGDDLLQSTAVVYFGHDDIEAQTLFSAEGDIRLAWGGKDAIEAISQLPKKYFAEDILFGPKISFMVIGKEYLHSEQICRKIARRAATDVSVFDQYGCSSPHTIFVEKGGKTSPREFAEILATEMMKAMIRIPKAPVDAGTAGKIASVRLRYEFEGDLWCSHGTEWTVLYDEDQQKGLAEPCYSRVITVRAVDDMMRTAEFVHQGIQTIGLGLDEPRKLEFAERATARGAERLPEIGRMTFFDTPWDGLFVLHRMVRWVTLGGPL